MKLFHSIKYKTYLLARENKLIVIMHFTLLNRKTLYIDIIESNTNKQKVTSVITLIMLFTRLWFENPFKLSRWTNKYSLTGKKRSILRKEEDELPLLCHKGIGITFCSVGILEKRNWSNRNTILTDANIGWVLLKTAIHGGKKKNKNQGCNALSVCWNCCHQKTCSQNEYSGCLSLVISQKL